MTVEIEKFVSGLNKQKSLMESLILKLQDSQTLSHEDCALYKETVKEVEKRLEKLRQSAFDQMMANFITQQVVF